MGSQAPIFLDNGTKIPMLGDGLEALENQFIQGGFKAKIKQPGSAFCPTNIRAQRSAGAAGLSARPKAWQSQRNSVHQSGVACERNPG
jgi:hypothetical protein